jgi:hypothetical protein
LEGGGQIQGWGRAMQQGNTASFFVPFPLCSSSLTPRGAGTETPRVDSSILSLDTDCPRRVAAGFLCLGVGEWQESQTSDHAEDAGPSRDRSHRRARGSRCRTHAARVPTAVLPSAPQTKQAGVNFPRPRGWRRWRGPERHLGVVANPSVLAESVRGGQRGPNWSRWSTCGRTWTAPPSAIGR